VNEKFDVKLGRASLNHSAWFYVPGGNVYQIILQKDLDVDGVLGIQLGYW